jgi:hypothetical protein
VTYVVLNFHGAMYTAVGPLMLRIRTVSGAVTVFDVATPECSFTPGSKLERRM